MLRLGPTSIVITTKDLARLQTPICRRQNRDSSASNRQGPKNVSRGPNLRRGPERSRDSALTHSDLETQHTPSVASIIDVGLETDSRTSRNSEDNASFQARYASSPWARPSTSEPPSENAETKVFASPRAQTDGTPYSESEASQTHSSRRMTDRGEPEVGTSMDGAREVQQPQAILGGVAVILDRPFAEGIHTGSTDMAHRRASSPINSNEIVRRGIHNESSLYHTTAVVTEASSAANATDPEGSGVTSSDPKESSSGELDNERPLNWHSLAAADNPSQATDILQPCRTSPHRGIAASGEWVRNRIVALNDEVNEDRRNPPASVVRLLRVSLSHEAFVNQWRLRGRPPGWFDSLGTYGHNAHPAIADDATPPTYTDAVQGSPYTPMSNDGLPEVPDAHPPPSYPEAYQGSRMEAQRAVIANVVGYRYPNLRDGDARSRSVSADSSRRGRVETQDSAHDLDSVESSSDDDDPMPHEATIREPRRFPVDPPIFPLPNWRRSGRAPEAARVHTPTAVQAWRNWSQTLPSNRTRRRIDAEQENGPELDRFEREHREALNRADDQSGGTVERTPPPRGRLERFLE